MKKREKKEKSGNNLEAAKDASVMLQKLERARCRVGGRGKIGEGD